MHIYTRLLHRDPDNARLISRLQEIKTHIAAEAELDGSSKQAGTRQKPAQNPRPLAGVRIKKEIKAKLKDKN